VKMQFDFDGNETPKQLGAIAAAISAYCGKMGITTFGIDVGADTVTMSAGVREAGQPQTQVMTPDALLEAAGFKEVQLPTELQEIKDAGGFRYGMSEKDIVTASKVFADAEPTIQIVPTEADAVRIFEEKEAPLLQQAAELDAAGKPWDKNIHASSRAKTADGCWKFKRGIYPALRQAAVVGTFTAEMTVPVEPQSTAVIPPPPPAPVATEAHTLPWLMGECAKRQKTKADIDAALASCGLKTIPDLLAQLDKMDAVAAALGVL